MSQYRLMTTAGTLAVLLCLAGSPLFAQGTGRTGTTTGAGAAGGGGAGAGTSMAGAGAGTSIVGDAPTVTTGITQNPQGAQTFLGAGGTGAFIGTTGGGAAAGQGRGGGQQFQSQNFNTRRQQQNTSASRILPTPQLSIGFALPEISAPIAQSRLNFTVAEASALPLGGERFQRVTPVIATNGTVTLDGSVPDERTRQLAEMLIRLEPGVRSVTNNLSVAP